jgi:hypothetical protein
MFVPLKTDGVVHNDVSGNLSTSLIQTIDIANSAVTLNKLDENLVLPINTTLNTTGVVSTELDFYKIVTKGFLASQIKEFTDFSLNIQSKPITFLHIDATNIDTSSGNPIFELDDKIRHIVDVSTKILLPPINREGIFYLVINKSGDSIVISTASITESIFNCFVAPDGDNEFILGNNQSLEFMSIVSNGTTQNESWIAKYY